MVNRPVDLVQYRFQIMEGRNCVRDGEACTKMLCKTEIWSTQVGINLHWLTYEWM